MLLTSSYTKIWGIKTMLDSNKSRFSPGAQENKREIRKLCLLVPNMLQVGGGGGGTNRKTHLKNHCLIAEGACLKKPPFGNHSYCTLSVSWGVCKGTKSASASNRRAEYWKHQGKEYKKHTILHSSEWTIKTDNRLALSLSDPSRIPEMNT